MRLDCLLGGEENFLKKAFLPRTPSFKNFETGGIIFLPLFLLLIVKKRFFALLQTVVGSIKYESLLQWEKVATRESKANDVVDG